MRQSSRWLGELWGALHPIEAQFPAQTLAAAIALEVNQMTLLTTIQVFNGVVEPRLGIPARSPWKGRQTRSASASSARGEDQLLVRRRLPELLQDVSPPEKEAASADHPRCQPSDPHHCPGTVELGVIDGNHHPSEEQIRKRFPSSRQRKAALLIDARTFPSTPVRAGASRSPMPFPLLDVRLVLHPEQDVIAHAPVSEARQGHGTFAGFDATILRSPAGDEKFEVGENELAELAQRRAGAVVWRDQDVHGRFSSVAFLPRVLRQRGGIPQGRITQVPLFYHTTLNRTTLNFAETMTN
jgi:hypothetical protein